ncbi:MAG TPA: hypothetical protein VLU25_02930 [Acidobacteriota bacterium]|nr:hypothetical protein [Acidobacteriota bacterium]
MNSCDSFQPLFESLLSGEALSSPAREALGRHAEECRECRQLLELHRELAQGKEELPGLTQSDFAAMRRRVLQGASARRAQRSELSPQQQPADGSGRPGALKLPPLWSAAAAVLLLVTGALLGRLTVSAQPFELAPGGGYGSLIREISAEAESNDDFSDVEESQFVFSDVSFRPLPRQRLALSFNVTRHVEVEEPVDSPLVKEVLAQSLMARGPDALGSRLKAVSLASQAMDPKVREALTFAMHRDESLAVRQKALSILAGLPMDPQVEDALLATLRDDPSVQMRLMALEVLGQHQVGSDALRQAIEEIEQRGDRAVLLKASRLRE